MNVLKFIFSYISCIAIIFSIAHADQSSTGIIKTERDVFQKWLTMQTIMQEQNLPAACTALWNQSNTAQIFKESYEKNVQLLRHTLPFLKTLTNNCVNNYGHMFPTALPEDFGTCMQNIHTLIATDMSRYINFLKETFPAPDYENRTLQDEINTYVGLMRFIFSQPTEQQTVQLLFTAANIFFEYCFSQATFHNTQKLFYYKEYHHILKLLYTTIWFNLAGDGWKHWHASCLEALKKRADDGHTIVYIAGGSDIYQLLKSGIYTIKNIDPQLPSQPKYYADGWEFLLQSTGPRNGLGDIITVDCGDKKITMQRTSYQESKSSFKVNLSTGETVDIPKSTTIWTIFDINNNKLGTYTLERRFCQQSDFEPADKKTLLISFNELYYVSLPQFLNGWNISITTMTYDQLIFVKQLRTPVTKSTLYNLHVADMINFVDLNYIALGSCIN